MSLTQGLGLYSQNQILTIGIRTENQAQTEEFLSIWIGDYELMHQQQKEYEDSLKAETAETTAETTAAAAD
ncbi:MAG TPA: hypothetical protein DD640_10405 [Clostridiales bacterium]|nr:hypothetical protein [Clostridiales bacterium]